MKNKTLAVVGLAALVLASALRVQVRADEVITAVDSSPLLYAKLNPVGATTAPMRVGPFSLPATAPESQPYPVKLALAAQPTAQSGQARGAKRISSFLLFEGTGDHLAEMVSVFGEQVVPPPEVSSLVHIEEPTAREASDQYRWTFWKYRNDANRPIFGMDFLFTYRYPTEGEAPRGFRSGEVFVGFGISVPLSNFKPIGRLFTSQ